MAATKTSEWLTAQVRKWYSAFLHDRFPDKGPVVVRTFKVGQVRSAAGDSFILALDTHSEEERAAVSDAFDAWWSSPPDGKKTKPRLHWMVFVVTDEHIMSEHPRTAFFRQPRVLDPGETVQTLYAVVTAAASASDESESAPELHFQVA